MTLGRRILAGVAIVLVAATLFIGWLGYFGGAVFEDMPARGARRPFAAVLMSGDLGLRIGMGPEMAHRLAADGVAVVGVNTLAYLRTTRAPADMTRIIEAAMRRAMALGHTDRVVLIGQSFGADMLHVGLADLSQALRAHVDRIALVVPENTVQFRASPSEIFDWWTPTRDALPTARALTWAPTLCVQGREETDSLCPLLRQANVRRVALPGGHPLSHDADALYAALSAFLFARA